MKHTFLITGMSEARLLHFAEPNVPKPPNAIEAKAETIKVEFAEGIGQQNNDRLHELGQKMKELKKKSGNDSVQDVRDAYQSALEKNKFNVGFDKDGKYEVKYVGQKVDYNVFKDQMNTFESKDWEQAYKLNKEDAKQLLVDLRKVIEAAHLVIDDRLKKATMPLDMPKTGRGDSGEAGVTKNEKMQAPDHAPASTETPVSIEKNEVQSLSLFDEVEQALQRQKAELLSQRDVHQRAIENLQRAIGQTQDPDAVKAAISKLETYEKQLPPLADNGMEAPGAQRQWFNNILNGLPGAYKNSDSGIWKIGDVIVDLNPESKRLEAHIGDTARPVALDAVFINDPKNNLSQDVKSALDRLSQVMKLPVDKQRADLAQQRAILNDRSENGRVNFKNSISVQQKVIDGLNRDIAGIDKSLTNINDRKDKIAKIPELKQQLATVEGIVKELQLSIGQTQDPDALMDAIKKLESYEKQLPPLADNGIEAPGAQRQWFNNILNGLPGAYKNSDSGIWKIGDVIVDLNPESKRLEAHIGDTARPVALDAVFINDPKNNLSQDVKSALDRLSQVMKLPVDKQRADLAQQRAILNDRKANGRGNLENRIASQQKLAMDIKKDIDGGQMLDQEMKDVLLAQKSASRTEQIRGLEQTLAEAKKATLRINKGPYPTQEKALQAAIDALTAERKAMPAMTDASGKAISEEVAKRLWVASALRKEADATYIAKDKTWKVGESSRAWFGKNTDLYIVVDDAGKIQMRVSDTDRYGPLSAAVPKAQAKYLPLINRLQKMENTNVTSKYEGLTQKIDENKALLEQLGQTKRIPETLASLKAGEQMAIQEVTRVAYAMPNIPNMQISPDKVTLVASILAREPGKTTMGDDGTLIARNK
ncbi:MAG: hypothetical protein WCG83_02670 [Candidatus Peregrinibacteria bacterium]